MTENTHHTTTWASTLPAPHARMESWRFGMPSAENIDALAPAAPADNNAVLQQAREYAAVKDAVQIVYANGRAVHIPTQLPQGLSVMSMADFTKTHPDYALPTHKTLGSERLAALNAAHRPDALVILATEEIPVALEILHFFTGTDVIAWPYTYVATKPNARLRILERHISGNDGAHYCAAVQQFDLAPDSSLKYALVQQLNEQSKAVELSHIIARNGAQMEHLTSHPGAVWARQETMCDVTGAGADVQLFSANSLSGHKKLDQRTYQNHVSRGAASNLAYANVLNDTADSVFSGMIMVAQGAHDTSAYQSNRNLLLSPKAEANSIPGLEILADGVQCSHGTAVSAISEEELFYLLSRGIPERIAKEMIARGFLQDTLAKFTDDAIREAVESIVLG